MDRLWAPWRYTYVSSKTKGCLFCKVSRQKKDKTNLLVYRGRHAFAILNLYPYNNGHVMVAPYRHVKDLSFLTDEEIVGFIGLVVDTQKRLSSFMKPDGFNIGVNIGRKAGAGYPGHVHIHIVPRWDGDTNFMPVIAKTKVISQSLKTLYQRLRNAYKK